MVELHFWYIDCIRAIIDILGSFCMCQATDSHVKNSKYAHT